MAGSDNGLAPVWHQIITRAYDDTKHFYRDAEILEMTI